ncbi:MAG: head GIN domain-containing protein [bacterium]
MKKYVHILAIALTTCLMLSCTASNTCLEGAGNLETQIRDLSSFESVSFMTAGNVFISQGDVQSVSVEANKDLIGKILTKVENGTLVINSDEKICPEKLNIYITMKELNSFKLFGTGNMYNFTPLNSEEINLKVSGSGNINFTDISAYKVGFLIMGSGNINVNGIANTAVMELNGSGNINAVELNSQYCDILVSGSGNTETLVNKELNVKIQGSGNVKYYGNPEKIKMDAVGSGKLKKIKAVS